MENWVNLEGNYMHLVADMSTYTGSAAPTDTVSVCSLGIYGTKYVRDEPLSTSHTVTRGQVSTITVPDIYSFYEIGNELAISLR